MFTTNKNHTDFLLSLLSESKHFSLVRFNEGEARVLLDEINSDKNTVRCVAPHNANEWEYDPKDDINLKIELKNSLKYRDKNYYIALQREGWHKYKDYLQNECKDIDTLSIHYFWSDDFCLNFYKTIVPLLYQYKNVNILCSNKSNIDKINIKFNKVYNKFESKNCWKQKSYIDETLHSISNTENSVYIFCIGFSSKIMINKLHILNNNNVYFDLGSLLDYRMYGKKTRGKHIW